MWELAVAHEWTTSNPFQTYTAWILEITNENYFFGCLKKKSTTKDMHDFNRKYKYIYDTWNCVQIWNICNVEIIWITKSQKNYFYIKKGSTI